MTERGNGNDKGRGTMHRAQANENNIKTERAQFIVPLKDESDPYICVDRRDACPTRGCGNDIREIKL